MRQEAERKAKALITQPLPTLRIVINPEHQKLEGEQEALS